MHLMIDLETLGTSNECPVISIGAVFFDKTGLKQTFYKVLNVEKQIDDGRKVDGSTIKWWMSQKDAAKKVFKEGAIDPKIGLTSFVNFVAEHADIGKVKPWGNGSSFDISIIENILNFYDVPIPWKYTNIRDYRTFKEFVYNGKGMSRQGTYHNALDDAVTQAEVVIKGMNL